MARTMPWPAPPSWPPPCGGRIGQTRSKMGPIGRSFGSVHVPPPPLRHREETGVVGDVTCILSMEWCAFVRVRAPPSECAPARGWGRGWGQTLEKWAVDSEIRVLFPGLGPYVRAHALKTHARALTRARTNTQEDEYIDD